MISSQERDRVLQLRADLQKRLTQIQPVIDRFVRGLPAECRSMNLMARLGQEARDTWRIVWKASAWWFRWRRDLGVLVSDESSEAERLEAAERLVLSYPPRFADPNVYPALRRMRKEWRRLGYRTARSSLYGWLLPQVAVAVGKDAHRPQYVRLGKDWLKCDRERKIKVVPAQLPFDQLVQWLGQRVYRDTAELIKDHALQEVPLDHDPGGPPTAGVQLEDAKSAAPLIALLTDDVLGTTNIFEHLTAREAEVFKRYLEDQSTAEIAGDLGLRASTVRVHRHHLRHKLRALAPTN